MAKNKNRMPKETEFTGLKSQDEIKSAIEKKQKLIDAMKNKNDKQPESEENKSIKTMLEEAETLLKEIVQLKGDVFADYEKKRETLLSNEDAQKIIEKQKIIVNEANTLLEQAKEKAAMLIKEAGEQASNIKNNAISSAETIAKGLKESADNEAKKTIAAANLLFTNTQHDKQESIISARQEAEKIIDQARKSAEDILANANNSADKIIEGAHQTAQNIIDKSNTDVETVRKNINNEHEELAAKRLSLETKFAEEIRETKEELEKKKEQLDTELLNTEIEKQRLEQAKNRYLKQIEAEDETIRVQAEDMFNKMDADLKAANQLLLSQHQELLKKYSNVCDDKIKYYTLLQSKNIFDLKTQNDVLQEEIRQLKSKIGVINELGINERNAGEFKGAKEQYDSLLTSNNNVQNENKKLKAQLAGMTGNDELVSILQRENAILTEDNEKYRQRLDAAKSRDEMLSPIRALPAFMIDNSNELELNAFDNELGWLNHIKKRARESGIVLNDRMYYAYHTALKTSEWSPLVVLAGVSGTGKSELPRQYAVHGGMQFVSVPVKPDWDSPASLFGYYNSIENKLEATDLLKALYHMQSDASFKNQMMIVLLDEMNLAHPEQYFADMLSKFESARGTKDGMTTIDIPLGAGEAPLNIKIGRNVLWTGTMNEDETTKGLSDKVVDRSNLITFPQPKELYDRTNCLIKEPEMVLTVEKWQEWKNSALKIDDPNLKDDMDQYRKCIESINGQLNHLGRSLGQRVWQSIQYYIVNYPSVIEAVQHNDWGRLKGYMKYAFCDAVAFKVMPKLRGLEVKGSNEKYISGIRDILIKNTTLKFVEDFDKAINLTSELFQWCSSDFMSEDELL